MNAAELLVELARQGFIVNPEGVGIRVAPANRLTLELRDRIRHHKPELLLLSPQAQAPAGPEAALAYLPHKWQESWGERAAILEYDGGLAREHAEATALAEVLCRRDACGTGLRPEKIYNGT